jgi:hypothetical protein
VFDFIKPVGTRRIACLPVTSHLLSGFFCICFPKRIRTSIPRTKSLGYSVIRRSLSLRQPKLTPVLPLHYRAIRPKSGIRTHDLPFPKRINIHRYLSGYYKITLLRVSTCTGREIRTLKILILNQVRIPFRHSRVFRRRARARKRINSSFSF